MQFGLYHIRGSVKDAEEQAVRGPDRGASRAAHEPSAEDHPAGERELGIGGGGKVVPPALPRPSEAIGRGRGPLAAWGRALFADRRRAVLADRRRALCTASHEEAGEP